MRTCVTILVPLFLLLVQACWSQTDARGPGYRNSDPPNCGSFHARDIHGDVSDQSGAPTKDAQVEVFDEASHQSLRKTVTDEAGRFSIGKLRHGLYRVVFSSPGLLTDDWAVTIAKWPDGGLFHSRAMRITLFVVWPDIEYGPPCRRGYSR